MGSERHLKDQWCQSGGVWVVRGSRSFGAWRDRLAGALGVRGACRTGVQGSGGGCQAALPSPAVVQRVQKVLQ